MCFFLFLTGLKFKLETCDYPENILSGRTTFQEDENHSIFQMDSNKQGQKVT